MAAGLRELSERELAIINKYSARHGAVRGLSQPVADSDGGIGVPMVRLGTLARLESRGVITRAEAEAGDNFHRIFQLAALDALKAADVSRIPAAAGYRAAEVSSSGERCRRQVSAAMIALGGAGSIAASAAWHIAGLEWNVSRWAVTARRPREQACGILVGALAALSAHFASSRRTRRA